MRKYIKMIHVLVRVACERRKRDTDVVVSERRGAKPEGGDERGETYIHRVISSPRVASR